MKLKTFTKFVNEDRDPGVSRLRSLGMVADLAGMQWEVAGEIDGTSTERDQRTVYNWRGPAGEMVESVVGELTNFKADYTIELTNGSTPLNMNS
jgi:hypothetical protein